LQVKPNALNLRESLIPLIERFCVHCPDEAVSLAKKISHKVAPDKAATTTNHN
jgi:hypothetical protein